MENMKKVIYKDRVDLEQYLLIWMCCICMWKIYCCIVIVFAPKNSSLDLNVY